MDIDVTTIEKRTGLKFWKYFKRIILSIVIFFLVFIGTVVILFYVYQDSIKKFIVDQINKQLTTDIQVKKIDLSLFQKFPYVSLTFTDVTAKDAIKSVNKGNLLKADNVYLEFSIWDLINKNYRISKIEVSNGFLNLLVFKDGTDNYHFWKPDTSKTKKSFSFNLQKVVLDNVNIRYKNFSANQDYSVIAKYMAIKGKFSSDDYTMYVNGKMLINHINVSGVTYFPESNTTIDVILNVNQKTDTYTFKEGGLSFGNLKFDVTGNIVYNITKHDVNFQVKGKELKLQSFIEEIPWTYRQYFDNYKGEGEFYFTALIKGSFINNDLPIITIDFGISKGQIVHKESKIALEDVSFTGEFTNGNEKTLSSSVLKIKDFHSKLKSGILEGNLTISNFLKPELSLTTQMTMKLQDIQDFLKLNAVSSLTGNMEMKVSFDGKLNSLGSFTANDFIKSTTSGTLKIANTEIAFKNDPRKYTRINGDFQFSNNDLIVNKLVGLINNSDFMIKGYFKNLLSYVFLEGQKLFIIADLTSVNTNLDELLENKATSTDTTYNLSFSDKLNVNLNVDIGSLSFNKFNASNISGKVILKNMQLLASPLSFNSMDGKINGLIMIDGSQKGKLLISCDAKVNKIDVSKLFYEFGNFGQKSLKDDNIKGKATADIQFAGVWSSDLKPDMDKIYTKTDIRIENGELLNFAPIKGLSKFLKLSDLNDVKFATLHNNIEIKNKTIYIPAMEIKSSAIDIIASGQHTFSNEINYNIKVRLSDILAQKAKKAKKENDEFGVVEDDGLHKTSLFIIVTGTVDNPIYKYDAKGVKAKLAVDFVKEKQNLKTILNDEFGWFKKDSVAIKKNKEQKNKLKPKGKNKNNDNLKKQEEGKFIIDWGNDNEKKDSVQ